MMMERRRALAVAFSIDRDNTMQGPLKLPPACLSRDRGKFENQVSWTQFSGCRSRHCDSPHKNGSKQIGGDQAAQVILEMTRRKPCLVLSDVLKTEQGRACLERLKQPGAVRNGGQAPGVRRKSDRVTEELRLSRPTRSGQKEATEDMKVSTPQTTPKSSSRSRHRRRLHSADSDVAGEEKEEAKEAPTDQDGAVDESFEDTESGEESSLASVKDGGGEPGKEQHVSRKRKGPQCNGTNTPKRQRGSVLRVAGEEREEAAASDPGDPAGSEEDADLASLDPSIVRFTVGADEPPEGVPPVPDFIAAPNKSLLIGQESSSEAIVLSSDEEESADPQLHPLLTVSDLDAVSKSPDVFNHLDMQQLEEVSLCPSADSCFMGLSFSTLHCGGHQGTANGDIMITQENIIIPLKDPSIQMELLLTFKRKELRRYSIWEQQEMETHDLLLKVDLEHPPPAALLFCVSDEAAAAVQQDLLKLQHQGSSSDGGKASPFILLTLRYPLEGMEGALLRSLLELDCLNSLAEERSFFSQEADRLSLDYMYTPVLSLDDSIELVRKSGLDSPLLLLMGLESPEPELEPELEPEPEPDPEQPEQEGPPEDTGTDAAPVDSPETEAEPEAETQRQSEETQEEQSPQSPAEKVKEEPVYTLSRRRTRGAYSVSLCEPDSRWTKYKHRGVTQRLIQFPPPPLKGGITVTMEDLQCLDSGLFLNDVIIDFYLKYLLHNASAAMTKRCHVFSSFFYKQLTRRDNASEGGAKDLALSCQKQRRHQRVKTWTRHVDIFNKDFLFVPVNQEAHWYLVVICFPGLIEPKTEDWSAPSSKSLNGSGELQDQEAARGSKSPGGKMESPATASSGKNGDKTATETEKAAEQSTKSTKPGPVKCTERTYQNKTVCKRPCILIMDSLKRSPHERVFRLLRDYLESEWEVRRSSNRDFGPDRMQSSHCRVPLQDNTSDCGLYLLQYVESFLKDPVVHFDLPLHLEGWFPRQQIRRKRDEIRDLILNLYRRQKQASQR